MNASKIKKLLEQAHRDFANNHELHNDAITPALRYKRNEDKECAAFICAIIAYGKVAHIQKSIEKILSPMGRRPVAWLKGSSANDLKSASKGWRHRFNTSNDMYVMLSNLKHIYETHSSLESFVKPSKTETASELLERLVEGFEAITAGADGRKLRKEKSFWFFLPRPSSGSACKRLNLYLRWMVGESEFDLSLWKSFDKKNLIIPLDVHVMRQSLALGLTKRKSADWKTAEDVTRSLKKLDANDPTRFDFALCHLGINGVTFVERSRVAT